jgi:type IV secretory pathway VirB6-like protein
MNTPSAAVYITLTNSLSRFFLEFYGALMDSFSSFFHAVFILYFIYVGYRYAINRTEGRDVWEVFQSCILVSIAFVAVFHTNLYYEYVVRPIFSLLTDMLGFVLGIIEKVKILLPKPEGDAQFFKDITSMTQLFTGLDLMFMDFIKTCGELMPSGWGYLNPGWLLNLLAILILIFAYAAMYLCFTFMFMMSYFMMWLLFYVGGIAIMLGCFKGTRGIFYGWLKMLFNYALVSIFTAMVVAICYSGISRSVFAMSRYDTTTVSFTADFLGLLVWCFICLAMTLKTPDLAAGLTSTVAGGTAGIAGAISGAGGMAAAGSVGATSFGGGAIGGIATKIGSMAGVVPPGMSATETLKQKLGIK